MTFSVHGGLILGNSINEVKGFTDKAREISNGSMTAPQGADAARSGDSLCRETLDIMSLAEFITHLGRPPSGKLDDVVKILAPGRRYIFSLDRDGDKLP